MPRIDHVLIDVESIDIDASQPAAELALLISSILAFDCLDNDLWSADEVAENCFAFSPFVCDPFLAIRMYAAVGSS